MYSGQMVVSMYDHVLTRGIYAPSLVDQFYFSTLLLAHLLSTCILLSPKLEIHCLICVFLWMCIPIQRVKTNLEFRSTWMNAWTWLPWCLPDSLMRALFHRVVVCINASSLEYSLCCFCMNALLLCKEQLNVFHYSREYCFADQVLSLLLS